MSITRNIENKKVFKFLYLLSNESYQELGISYGGRVIFSIPIELIRYKQNTIILFNVDGK